MHLNVENDYYMYLHVYKPQEYFLQPISDLLLNVNEKWGYCFHWLNCGFHSFWSISVQEKVLKSLSTSRTIYLYLN